MFRIASSSTFVSKPVIAFKFIVSACNQLNKNIFYIIVPQMKEFEKNKLFVKTKPNNKIKCFYFVNLLANIENDLIA